MLPSSFHSSIHPLLLHIVLLTSLTEAERAELSPVILQRTPFQCNFVWKNAFTIDQRPLKKPKRGKKPFSHITRRTCLEYFTYITYWIWLHYVPSYTHRTDHESNFHLEWYCNPPEQQKNSDVLQSSWIFQVSYTSHVLKNTVIDCTSTWPAIRKSCADGFHNTPGHPWQPGTMFTGHCSSRMVQGNLAAAVLQLWELCSTAEPTSLGEKLTLIFQLWKLTWSALSPVPPGNTKIFKSLKYLLSITGKSKTSFI